MAEKSYFGESKNIEFKREIPQKHEKFLKDIIAFANCSGGKVILGIEDNTNAICGIGDANPFRLSDNITNMISDACTPQIETDITPQTLDGKTILVIEVFPGKHRPYYLKSIGKENSAYIRTNGTSRPADSWRLKELEIEGQNIYYDMLPEIGMDYDEKEAQKLCHIMYETALNACETPEEREHVQKMTIEKLENMGLLLLSGHEYSPTHAFRLMTVNGIRHAKIQCALFKGTSRSVFIDRKEFKGPVYEQIEEAYQFVCRHTSMGAEINGLYRRDIYELPVRSVREAIINAVAHRSYYDDSCAQVSIYDDRLEVYSPGALYGGLSIQEAIRGKSRSRNAAITEALHYMKIMEAWGTGLQRILDSCREYDLKEPLMEEEGYGFRITFFRERVSGNEIVVSRDEKVVNNEKKVVNDKEKVVNDEKRVVNGEEKVVNTDTEIKETKFSIYQETLIRAGITKKYILNIEKVYGYAEATLFSQSDVMQYLDCSKAQAIKVMSAMKQAGVIRKVEGKGRGKYQFV